MAIELNDNIKVLAPKPIDSRYFKTNNVPWVSVSEVNLTIPSFQRHQGLTVNIAGVEYWYKDGIGDVNLIVKLSGLASFNTRTGAITLLSTDVTGALLYTPANKAGDTFTGAVTVPSVIVSGETASRIASFDGSKNIKSLDTATYPSLTELTLLKGITGSTVQTQLNLKANAANPALTGKATFVGSTATSNTDVLFDVSQTWDGASIAPTIIKASVTETQTASVGALFLDFKLNGTTKFSVSKQGNVFIGGTLALSDQILQSVWESSGANNPSRLRFKGTNAAGFTPKGLIVENAANSNIINNISGTFDLISADTNFTPTSGTGTFNFLSILNQINQTGGANGITRGLYVNPNLTSAFDFRAIDVTKGSVVLPYQSATTNYPIKTSDYLIDITSGTVTATLPTAVGCQGKNYIIKNSGASSLTLATTSSETIDGSTTLNLNTLYKYVHVVSTGTNWIIIANN